MQVGDVADRPFHRRQAVRNGIGDLVFLGDRVDAEHRFQDRVDLPGAPGLDGQGRDVGQGRLDQHHAVHAEHRIAAPEDRFRRAVVDQNGHALGQRDFLQPAPPVVPVLARMRLDDQEQGIAPPTFCEDRPGNGKLVVADLGDAAVVPPDGFREEGGHRQAGGDPVRPFLAQATGRLLQMRVSGHMEPGAAPATGHDLGAHRLVDHADGVRQNPAGRATETAFQVGPGVDGGQRAELALARFQPQDPLEIAEAGAGDQQIGAQRLEGRRRIDGPRRPGFRLGQALPDRSRRSRRGQGDAVSPCLRQNDHRPEHVGSARIVRREQ